MPHNTPSFWYPKDGDHTPVKAKLLQPLSCLYGLGFKIHQTIKTPQKVDIPVVCIGNLSAGGTGKTPTCLSVLEIVKESGIVKNPHFLMRGYGGAERGPLLVDRNKHSAWDVGDESLILSEAAPTIVSADRYSGAKLASAYGADLVIMDDGLQNPGIHKDIKIIVVNGEMGFGNGRVMPAGPLREPLQSGLKKADAFLLIGEDRTNVTSLLPDKPLFHGKLEVAKDDVPPKDQPYLAFAGLGYPEKFFNFLTQDLKYDIVESIAFADHCPYARNDLLVLREKAKAQGAKLITTKKDFLRLPKGYKEDVFVLPVTMHIKNSDALRDFLNEGLS